MPNGSHSWKVSDLEVPFSSAYRNSLFYYNLIYFQQKVCALTAVEFCPHLLCFFSDQLPVSTKYDLRSDPGVEKNYGKLLLEMVSVVPDGIVCFFVSYSYMDGIVNSWHESGILKVNIPKTISWNSSANYKY